MSWLALPIDAVLDLLLDLTGHPLAAIAVFVSLVRVLEFPVVYREQLQAIAYATASDSGDTRQAARLADQRPMGWGWPTLLFHWYIFIALLFVSRDWNAGAFAFAGFGMSDPTLFLPLFWLGAAAVRRSLISGWEAWNWHYTGLLGVLFVVHVFLPKGVVLYLVFSELWTIALYPMMPKLPRSDADDDVGR